MELKNILEFKGTWRSYQARVLKNVDKYLNDGKLHIVAAPGSGKTTLGIEFIKRLSKPVLILAPTITIRQQWKARIQEGFLADDINIDEIVSMDLRHPSLITIATYQSLHSAMTGFAGNELSDSNSDTDDTTGIEAVDFSNFDVVDAAKEAGIDVLCLDECHHLRSEWWKSLESFRSKLGSPNIISLTGTEPYDSTPVMWQRYMDMCGEVDEEISIPELLKEGSICPHQDYVYLCHPAKEELKAVDKFLANSNSAMWELTNSEKLDEIVQGHIFLKADTPLGTILEDSYYLSAILIYMQHRLLPFPAHIQKIIPAGSLPEMNEEWMEILLQKLLFDDPKSFGKNAVYVKEIRELLNSLGLIERKHVLLAHSEAVDKTLITSKNKINGVVDIANAEYESLGDDLRMLILTDYIRKDTEQIIGLEDQEPDTLGVLPFFEALRRNFVRKVDAPSLGVLCGSIVIIPASIKAPLLAEMGIGKVTFSEVGLLLDCDYVKVTPTCDSHELTAAMTRLFTKGEIQILVGTKSLLGEGWDAPCINSLILASFVGSYMLSNQMRGRAIRVWSEVPGKTSNIWHLVCLSPAKYQGSEDNPLMYSEDLNLLKRRMDNFMGLNYVEDIIETGIQRISYLPAEIYTMQVDKINKKMLATSRDRSQLFKRWNQAIVAADKNRHIEVVRQSTLREEYIRRTFSPEAVGLLNYMSGVLLGGKNGYATYLLKRFGNGIIRTLRSLKLLEDTNVSVRVSQSESGEHHVYLYGGTTRDKELFSNCLSQFLAPVKNQRYILINDKAKTGNIFFCVPDVFGKKKDDASLFVKNMGRFLKKYELVYTRNETGKEKLLQGRLLALKKSNNPCVNNERAINVKL